MFPFIRRQQHMLVRRSGVAFSTARNPLLAPPLAPPPLSAVPAGPDSTPNPFLTTDFGTRSGSSSGSSVVNREEVIRLAKMLEADPEFARRVVSAMAPEARRQLVVAGGAVEWFGKERAATEVLDADENRDLVICPKDFDRWFERALQRRVEQHKAEAAAAAAVSADGKKPQGSDDTDAKKASGSERQTHDDTHADSDSSSARVPFRGLFFVALQAALPFVGFGFLDNAVMILAGDAIDRTLGFYFGCTVMASAAMGNVVSGAMGMQVHGTVERMVHLLRLPTPVLTEAQRASRRVFLAGHLGGTFGIAIGLTLGMLPLLFISDEAEKSDKRAFVELDVNKDGFVSMVELDAAIAAAGLAKSVSHVRTEQLVAQYGAPGALGLTTQQFHAMCSELRKQSAGGLLA